MVKGFDEYIKESLGAITIERKPADKLNQPDYITHMPNIRYSGRSSAVPTHWNNSPFMSGGNYGPGALSFGANPNGGDEDDKTNNVLSYENFIATSKKFQKKDK